mmetsp:Transcript_10737/g.16834  ORF Transcript_10737/g.16834 Transcript_10737/m.16834 type:complete len:247 (+) Transcript_10737:2-742(+)
MVRECIKASASRSSNAALGSWIPVCDVSGSMTGEPMEVAIALSLLLCESAPKDSPWHSKMFTFHSSPKMVSVPGVPDYEVEQESMDQTLGSRVNYVRGIEWGGSTNIEATLEQVLAQAKKSKLSKKEMAHTAIVIFSDMEFDQARGRSNIPWETAHEALTFKYRDAGFGPAPPLVVFWNLRASRSTPVGSKHEKGVVMLSGFSAGLLKSFLAGNLEEFTPMGQMRAVLDNEQYANLKVIDQDCLLE